MITDADQKIVMVNNTFNEVTGYSNEEAIVGAIVALAQNLRLRVIAEGVETSDQLAHLRTLGCDEVQGYHFSKPLRAADFSDFIMRHEPAVC